MIAYACLLFPGWTPTIVLEMKAALFFQMVIKGRALAHRARYRNYRELCLVSMYPSCTEDSKQELMQYFYDNSLSPHELRARERVRLEMEAEAKKNYLPPSAALDMFRGRA